MKVVILADEIGDKLWPVTSAEFPKALLPVHNPNSSLGNTIERIILGLDNLGQDLFIVLPEQSKKTFDLLNIAKIWQIPAQNIIYIPSYNGSILSMFWALLYMEEVIGVNLSEQIMFMPADHFYDPKEGFLFHLLNVLSQAKQMNGKLTVFCMEPSGPATHLNYLEYQPESTQIVGKELLPPVGFPSATVNTSMVNVTDYNITPDEDSAAELMLGNWAWDLHVYIARMDFFLSVISRRYIGSLEKLSLCIDTKKHWFRRKTTAKLNYKRFVQEYNKVPSIGDFDSELLPQVIRSGKAQAVFMGALSWTTLDNWVAIKYLLYDSGYMKTEEPPGIHLVDSKGTFVFKAPQKEVAVFGVQNLIVIDTQDKLLIGTPEGLHENF